MKSYYTAASGRRYFQQRIDQKDEIQEEYARKIERFIIDGSTILDFGCGSGGILNNLSADKRIGIEINEDAATKARQNGIAVIADFKEIPNSSIDVVLSHHSLEHVEAPIVVLQSAHRVLREHGRIIVVVPGEVATLRRQAYTPEDVNHHLYSWTPLSLGNLLCSAGFSNIEGHIRTLRYHSIPWSYSIPKITKRAISIMINTARRRFDVICVGEKN